MWINNYYNTVASSMSEMFTKKTTGKKYQLE